MPYKLYNDDCFNIMQKLVDDNVEVDMILTDLPYGTVKGLDIDGWTETSTEWDNRLDTEKIFSYSEKLLKEKCPMVLFSQEPYTSYLRQYNYTNMFFTYPLYWIKNHFANPLLCKKAPVNYVEDLSVFRKKYDSNGTNPLRNYAQDLLKYISKSSKDIERDLGSRKAEHFFYSNNSMQFSLCSKNTYNELTELYNLKEWENYKPYSELLEISNSVSPTFNLRNNKFLPNILEYSKPTSRFHPTEKPVDLLIELINTYTNENDTVLDFTMGSGSTGVACMNTNRKFIGIEIDTQYYKIANDRINKANEQNKLL